MNKILTVGLTCVTSFLNRMKKMAKCRHTRTTAMLIAVWPVMMAVFVACSSCSSKSTPSTSSGTPTPDGETLLETRCSVCHSADRPKQARKTRDQWDQTVTRMIDKGAVLTGAEKTALVDYLAKTYGP